MKIGEFINAYRNEHKMSMEELATKCGLSKAYISKLEADVSAEKEKYIKPSIQTFNKIANGLNISLTDLLQALDNEQEVTLETDYEIKEMINKGYLKEINAVLQHLNDKGKKEAVKRIQELSYIPCYTNSTLTSQNDDEIPDNDVYIVDAAARGNSRQQVKLSKKSIEEILKKPSDTSFDD